MSNNDGLVITAIMSTPIQRKLFTVAQISAMIGQAAKDDWLQALILKRLFDGTARLAPSVLKDKDEPFECVFAIFPSLTGENSTVSLNGYIKGYEGQGVYELICNAKTRGLLLYIDSVERENTHTAKAVEVLGTPPDA